MAAITERAMIVRLSISQWTARKLDKKITREVAAAHGTSEDAGRYNKLLVAESAVKSVSKAANEARTYHYENTLPWDDAGGRILPCSHFMDYTAGMRERRAAFEQAVEEMVSSYPALVEDAKRRLNGMFNPADYPGPQEMASKYHMSTDIAPVPAAEDFRVDLDADQVSTIRTQIEGRCTALTNAAMGDLWQRLYDAVKRMGDKLGEPGQKPGKGPLFRDSLVGNVVDLCKLLPKLNLTNDPQLETMREAVEARLTKATADELRGSPQARVTACTAADDITRAMAGYMGAATPAT